MTTNSLEDPGGYYAALGLDPGASFDEIKAAYRARAKAVHPDGGAEKPEEFHRISEAYAVLRDAVRRAEYDSTGSAGGEDDTSAPLAPFACGRCGQITAQPRYIIFHRVKSFLLWARVQRVEGIFCRDCADIAAAQTSTYCWTWGWWSIPGLILTPLALLRNVLGGVKPRHVNARILIRQARAFLARGDHAFAYAVAHQAKRYARVASHRRQVEDILTATTETGRKLRDRWQPWAGPSFIPQLLPLVALPVTIAVFLVLVSRPWERQVGAFAGISVAPPLVGEIRHVAVDALKVRQAPTEGAPVLTLLDRFTAVTTIEVGDEGDWTKIKAPSGVTGYVPVRTLYGGSGELLRQQWCGEHRGSNPEAGEVLLRRASGEHRLLIHNEGRADAVVKLKTQAGYTVAAYFIPATYTLGVGGIPEGTFSIEFATGKRYSRGCGMFLEDMSTGQLPFTLTLHHVSALRAAAAVSMPEISLVTAPGDIKAAKPIKADQYMTDD